MLQIILFIIFSTGIIYVSRASLRKPKSHGFYRFWVWEIILAQVILNIKVWFNDPFSWYQIISWILLTVCLIPLAFGIYSLRSRGKPVKHRESQPDLLAFEKTSALVTTGIYRYIRHPLYSSLLFLTWGVFFKSPPELGLQSPGWQAFSGWPGLALALASTLFLVATAKADENECETFFGPPYRAYMENTKRFVPFLF